MEFFRKRKVLVQNVPENSKMFHKLSLKVYSSGNCFIFSAVESESKIGFFSMFTDDFAIDGCPSRGQL